MSQARGTMSHQVGDKEDAVFYASGANAPSVVVTTLDRLTLPKPIRTKVLLPGPKGSLLEMHLSADQQIPRHRFSHDFINFVVRGRVRVELAGQQHEAEPRDAWAGAAGLEHSITALEDSTVLEWMGPPHIVSGPRLITWGGGAASDSYVFTKWSGANEFLLKEVEGTTEFGPPDKDVKLRLKVLIPGPYGALVWSDHLKGKVAFHTHKHSWVCYLIKGRVKENFGGREHICEPGDIWAAASGALHRTEAVEDVELVEFKWPAPMLWNGVIRSWDPR